MNTNTGMSIIQANERGEVARKKLIEAGLRIYSEVGYQSASTRRLAADAGVNIAAILYYFGSKEGLYHAVLDFIVEYYHVQLDDELDRIKTALADPRTTSEQYLDLLDGYMRALVNFVLREGAERAKISRIYIREQLDPTSGFARLYHGFIKEMREMHETLIANILGRDAHDLEVKLLSQTLIGQMTIFKSSQVTVLKYLEWEQYGEERVASIERVVSMNVRALMQAYQTKGNEL